MALVKAFALLTQLVALCAAQEIDKGKLAEIAEVLDSEGLNLEQQ
jgi:hypothetical protein